MKTSKKKTAPRQSLGAIAYEKIYKKIISLEYKPGENLEEKELMKHLGLGRTPVREALLRLSAELMVESHPNKGFVVRQITLQNTRAVFEALKIFELGIAGLAVRHDATPFLSEMLEANETIKVLVAKGDILGLVEANHDFHMSFARCSGNEYLTRGIYEVRCEANRLSYLSYGGDTEMSSSLHEHYTSVIRQHEKIMDIIKKRDEVKLKQVICEHIRIFQQRIINYMMS
ncbi:MAG: GntR family transcriptional regulator [Desulfobacteraceae bacterium]|nr:GntR family transcriptional regulator [Desulfobacteraceae bacterium]